jgi:DNA-binding NarL/FixJ family response regulator
VDDEQLARDELCFLLEQLGGIEVVGQAGTAWSAARNRGVPAGSRDARRPDAGLTGFEVARRVVEAGSSRSWSS